MAEVDVDYIPEEMITIDKDGYKIIPIALSGEPIQNVSHRFLKMRNRSAIRVMYLMESRNYYYMYSRSFFPGEDTTIQVSEKKSGEILYTINKNDNRTNGRFRCYNSDDKKIKCPEFHFVTYIKCMEASFKFDG